LKDRFDTFAQRWAGLDYEVFHGVDCQDYNVHIGRNPTKAQRYFMTNFFATVSAFQLLEHCLNFNDHCFWIMEDDAFPILPINQIQTLIELAKERFPCEVLKLFSEEAELEIMPLDTTHTLVQPTDFVSTVSWVVTRQVVERFVSDPWLASIDRYVWYMAYNVAIKPDIVGC
jgi:hypothetical protein